jgi:hypothetical protein
MGSLLRKVMVPPPLTCDTTAALLESPVREFAQMNVSAQKWLQQGNNSRVSEDVQAVYI